MVIFLSSFSVADDFEYTVKTKLSEEYSDNIFFSSDTNTGKTKDSYSSLTTQLMLSNSGERLKTDLAGSFTCTLYQRYNDLNNKDWNVKSSLTWSLSDQTSFMTSIMSQSSSDASQFISESGLLLINQKHDSSGWNGTISHQFSEFLTSQFKMEYADHRAKTDTILSKEDTLITKNISSAWSYQSHECLTFNLNAGYGINDYKTSKTELVYAQIGFTGLLNETDTLSFNIGSRYTTFTYDEIIGINYLSDPVSYIYNNSKASSWGTIGSAGLNIKIDNGDINLSIEESLQASAGISRSLSRTSFLTSISKWLNPKVFNVLTAQYWLNRNDGADLSAPLRTKTYQITQSLTYSWTDDFSMTGRYNYTNYRSMGSGIDVSRNVFGIDAELKF